MSRKRQYQFITEREKWTLPFFKAFAGFCPFYAPSQFDRHASLSHGLDLAGERRNRISIIKYMFTAGGGELQSPLNTICIAIVYFHKFFQSISIRAHDPYYVATACLYTAAKQEESRVRLDHCARALHRHQFAKRYQPQYRDYHHPSKEELNTMCRRLAIAELLVTQQNQFNYNITLPFDYLLPIICQWKALYVPRLTNTQSLKCVYLRHAWLFVKQSFYIPVNIILPPQKIAIVAMELALRLNYTKYQIQQEKMSNLSMKSLNSNKSISYPDSKLYKSYRFIDPPLHWFRIFAPNQNEQDLKDEVQLIALELISAIEDWNLFGIQTDKVPDTVELLKQWRRSIKMDLVHKQLLESIHCIQNNDNNSKIPIQAIHKAQKQCETSLQSNTQTISPASLEPHGFYTAYPLQAYCTQDMSPIEEDEKQIDIKSESIEKKSRVSSKSRLDCTDSKAKKDETPASKTDKADGNHEFDRNESEAMDTDHSVHSPKDSLKDDKELKSKPSNYEVTTPPRKSRNDRKRKRDSKSCSSTKRDRKKRKIDRESREIRDNQTPTTSSDDTESAESESSTSSESDSRETTPEVSSRKTRKRSHRKRSRSISKTRSKSRSRSKSKKRSKKRSKTRSKSRSRSKSKSRSSTNSESESSEEDSADSSSDDSSSSESDFDYSKRSNRKSKSRSKRHHDVSIRGRSGRRRKRSSQGSHGSSSRSRSGRSNRSRRVSGSLHKGSSSRNSSRSPRRSSRDRRQRTRYRGNGSRRPVVDGHDEMSQGPDRFDEWKMSRPNHRNKIMRRNNMGNNQMGNMNRNNYHNNHHNNKFNNNKFNKGYYRPPHAQNIGSFKEHLRLQQQQQQQMQQQTQQPPFGYNPMNQMNEFGVINPTPMAPQEEQQDVVVDYGLDGDGSSDNRNGKQNGGGIYNNMKVETRGGS